MESLVADQKNRSAPIGSKNRGTVYVVQGTDLGKFVLARRYGDLVRLVQRDVFPDDAEERVIMVHNILHRHLAHFNMDRDYLLLAGDPIAIILSGMILAKYVPWFNVLKWDRENQDYYAVRVEV